MIKLLEKIVISSVLVVILIHTFTPHLYSDRITEAEHSAIHNDTDSLFDLISFSFHENNHENLDHLIVTQNDGIEKYEIEQSNSTIDILNCSLSVIEKALVNQIIQRDTNSTHKIFIVHLNTERGPPSVA